MEMLYPVLRDWHYWLSRIGIIAGLVMLGIAIYIGLIRHGDVTRWFRRGVYAMVAFMVVESLIGLLMYAQGGRPHEEVHLIYGMGAVLALPFFIFVETTAKKRPAMGSYIWGFGIMTAIIVRTIMTGAAG
jgi:heme A synthase